MKFWQKIIFVLLLILSLILSGTVFFLWQEIKSFEPIVYYNIPPEKSFIYSSKELIFGIESYLKEAIEKETRRLKDEKRNFVYADLQKMELTLYKEGEEFKKFPITAKGAEWFWGETPTGIYYAQNKFRLTFSSASQAWMPYAIQFFGNYFIHGIPYDKKGRLLKGRVSGGCIRLNTQDSHEVFDFVKEEMPILVFDEKSRYSLPALTPISKEVSPPNLQSQFVFIADLDTGEIILNKEGVSEFYAGSATNIILALTVAESINLDKRITAKKWMFEEIEEGIIAPGKSYRGYDLLSPLLLKSSKEAALTLSRFRTPEDFVVLMQQKIKSLGLENTFLVDLTGESLENKTTLYDVAKIFRYLKDYRKFILDIANQILGPGEDGKKSKFALFKMEYHQNEEIRNIFVGLANSSDVEDDTKLILEWLEENFSLIKI